MHIYLLFNVITRICETEPKYCLMSIVNFLYLNRIIWLTDQASANLVKYILLVFPYCVVQFWRRDAHIKRVIKIYSSGCRSIHCSTVKNKIEFIVDLKFFWTVFAIYQFFNYSDTAENINALCSLNDSAKHMTY